MNTNKNIAVLVIIVAIAAIVAYAFFSGQSQEPADAGLPSAPPDATTGLPTTLPPGQTATSSATSTASSSTSTTPALTQADNGKTLTIAQGQRLVIKLGDTLNWTVNISDQSVLSRVKNIMVIRGSQGVYTALKPGTVTITAEGRPICNPGEMCAQYIVEWRAAVVVR